MPSEKTTDASPRLLGGRCAGVPGRSSGCAGGLRVPGSLKVCAAPDPASAPHWCLVGPEFQGAPGGPTSTQTGGAGGTPWGALGPGPPPQEALCFCPQSPMARCVPTGKLLSLCLQVVPCRRPRPGEQEDRTGTGQERGWHRGCVLGLLRLAAPPADSSAHAPGSLPRAGRSPSLPWQERAGSQARTRGSRPSPPPRRLPANSRRRGFGTGAGLSSPSASQAQLGPKGPHPGGARGEQGPQTPGRAQHHGVSHSSARVSPGKESSLSLRSARDG